MTSLQKGYCPKLPRILDTEATSAADGSSGAEVPEKVEVSEEVEVPEEAERVADARSSARSVG